MRPATFARITGVVYLLYFVTAFASAQLTAGITGMGSVAPDAIHRSTYQPGIAIGEVSTMLYLALVVLLYRLLRQANGTVAVLALAFGATGIAVTAVAAVFQSAAVADPALLRINGRALHAALLFFAGFDAFVGYLIYRSGVLPRFIGVWMVVAGVGWLAALAPSIPSPLAIPLAVIGGSAEVVLMVWLLVFGVRPASGSAGGDSLAHHDLARAE